MICEFLSADMGLINVELVSDVSQTVSASIIRS
jgi:hypothetical protein